jgi:hypothetical protein
MDPVTIERQTALTVCQLEQSGFAQSLTAIDSDVVYTRDTLQFGDLLIVEYDPRSSWVYREECSLVYFMSFVIYDCD